MVPGWGLLGSTAAYGALVATLALLSAAAALLLRRRMTVVTPTRA